MTRLRDGIACSVIALVVASGATAQTRPAATVAAVPVDPAAEGEIIVTAQRRSQRLQDVPIAITALSGTQLAANGIKNALDLTIAVPGLNFARSSYSGQPTIGGVGTRNTANGDEANVATYVDGVYQSKAFALFLDLADVDSVQVLKGPQGTLFGRNATGGAILLTTRDPSQNAAVDADLSVGNYGYIRGHVYLNAPVTKGISFNISAVGVGDNGYTRDLVNGGHTGVRDAYYVRGKIKFELGSDTNLIVSGFSSSDKNNGFIVNNSYLGNNSARRTSPTTFIASDPYTVSSDLVNHNIVKVSGGSYTLTHDFGGAKLTAIGAYQHATLDFLSDSDRTILVGPLSLVKFNDNSFSQEVLLTSPDKGRFNWTIGGFYFSSNDHSAPIEVDPGALFLNSDMKTKSYSAFGEATYQAAEHIFLTLGGRYSHEKRDYNARQTVPTVVNATNSASFNNFSPRAIARYEFSGATSAYVSYSRGFKSGIFNGNSADVTQVNPENLNAYEAGLKTGLFDRRLQLNMAVFYDDYKNLQVQTVAPNNTSQLQNAASSRIYGLDADFNWRVASNFDVHGGISLLHDRFTDFPKAQLYQPIVLANGLLGGNTSSFGSVTGNRLIRTPDYTFNLGGNYSVPFADGKLDFATQLFLSGSYYFDVQNRTKQNAYTLVNGNITWHAQGDRWSIGVYGENLADVVRYGSIVSTSRGDTVSYLRPRSFGVKAGVSF